MPGKLRVRGAIGAWMLIYVILIAVPFGLGCYLVIAPTRAGNFLNEAFAVYPQVRQRDWAKRLFYQVLAVGLMIVSVFYFLQIYHAIVQIYRGIVGRG